MDCIEYIASKGHNLGNEHELAVRNIMYELQKWIKKRIPLRQIPYKRWDRDIVIRRKKESDDSIFHLYKRKLCKKK